MSKFLSTGAFKRERKVSAWLQKLPILFLRLGFKLKIMHRLLEFNQLNWLKPYVKSNTKRRIGLENYGDKDKKSCKN